MSASKFYTSCQDLYRETSYNDQIVANVFDKNSKVCYIIFDTPYYLTDNYEDEKQKVSEFLPICWNIIRLVKDSLYFDKTYPQRMAKVIERLITDYTGMTNEEDNSTIYQPNIDIDIDFNDEEYLAAPYMDRLNLTSNLVNIGLNTKYFLANPNTVNKIIANKIKIEKDNSVIKLCIDIPSYDDLLKFYKTDDISDIFPKLSRIETLAPEKYEDILSYNNTICLYRAINTQNILNDIVKKDKDYLNILEITSCDDSDIPMPDISDLKELMEIDIIFSYKILSQSLLNLPKLKIIRISRNVERFNRDLIKSLRDKKIKIEVVGI